MARDIDHRESRGRSARLAAAIEAMTIEVPHEPRRFVGRVASIPSGTPFPPVYLDTHPVAISGPETPGTAATLTTDESRTVPVLMLGETPSLGQLVVAKNVAGRWVATVPGVALFSGNTGIIPGCFCSPTPANLYMTSADPDCNFGMFQTCEILWGPRPSWGLAAGLPANCYLSTQGFTDDGPLYGGLPFYYYLACDLNLWTLTRIYPAVPQPDNPDGSPNPDAPFRDAVLYTWVMGGGDGDLVNQCGVHPSTYELNPAFQAWADCIVATYPGYASLEPLGYDPALGTLSPAATTALTSIRQDYADGITRGCGPPPPTIRSTLAANAFKLVYGSAFPGSDLSCNVEIVG